MKKFCVLAMAAAFILSAVTLFTPAARADGARIERLMQSNVTAMQVEMKRIINRRNFIRERQQYIDRQQALLRSLRGEERADYAVAMQRKLHEMDLEHMAVQMTYANADYRQDMRAMLAELYDSTLSDAEIAEKTAFFDSPAGRQMLGRLQEANAAALRVYTTPDYNATRIDPSENALTPAMQQQLAAEMRHPLAKSALKKTTALDYLQEYRYRAALLSDKYLQEQRYELGLERSQNRAR